MVLKSRKPIVSLVTRKRDHRAACKPDLDIACVPGAGPGFLCNESKSDKINSCSPPKPVTG